MAGNQGKRLGVSFHNAGSRGCGSLTLGMERRFISALGPIHRGWPMTLSSLSFHLQMTWLCGVSRWNYRTDTKRIWVLRLSLLSQIVRRGVGQTLWMPLCSPIGWVPWQLCWQPLNQLWKRDRWGIRRFLLSVQEALLIPARDRPSHQFLHMKWQHPPQSLTALTTLSFFFFIAFKTLHYHTQGIYLVYCLLTRCKPERAKRGFLAYFCLWLYP